MIALVPQCQLLGSGWGFTWEQVSIFPSLNIPPEGETCAAFFDTCSGLQPVTFVLVKSSSQPFSLSNVTCWACVHVDGQIAACQSVNKEETHWVVLVGNGKCSIAVGFESSVWDSCSGCAVCTVEWQHNKPVNSVKQKVYHLYLSIYIRLGMKSQYLHFSIIWPWK